MKPHSISTAQIAVVLEVAKLFPAVVLNQAPGQCEQVTLNDLAEIIHRQANSMVGHAVLREIIGPYLLRAISGSNQGAPSLIAFGAIALLNLVEESAAENAHGLGLVLVLAPLVAAIDDNAGREVSDPHPAFGLVLVLTARSAGTHDI